jgi:NADH pyrophosphatase NudC (nudix superfamily)
MTSFAEIGWHNSVAEGKKFTSGVVPPKARMEPAWWFVLREDDLLIEPESSEAKVPCLLDVAELKLPILGEHYVGRLGGPHCYPVDVAKGTTAPQKMTFEGLRQIFTLTAANYPRSRKKN